MTNLNLDKYLNIANEEKAKYGIKEYAPLYPMLRVENNNLYIGIMFTMPNDNVWDINEQIKPSHWMLIDTKDFSIIEVNKTEEKDFVTGTLIPKDITDKQKEISKYTVEKTLQYEKYLMEDIKNDSLPIQKKLATILNNDIDVGGNKVNINDYLISNLEEDIKEKFGALYTAFQYGTPPHAGAAPGLDRMIMLIANSNNIREVIAFPKNKNARDVMVNAPSKVTEKQLEDVHIQIRKED